MRARNTEVSIVASHETDPGYCINCDPVKSSIYHREKNQRILEEFGSDVMKYFEFFNMYNAGLFAAVVQSPILGRYKSNLSKKPPFFYSSNSEQKTPKIWIVEMRGEIT